MNKHIQILYELSEKVKELANKNDLTKREKIDLRMESKLLATGLLCLATDDLLNDLEIAEAE